MKKKALVNIKGGLGNQLFIILFANYLKKNGFRVYHDIGYYDGDDPYGRNFELKLKNLKLIPPEIAIYSASLINIDKKTGKWFRFATPLNSMVDSDKVPHLPKFGYALGRKFIETYWSYPKAVFYPHNDFIVCKEK